ncbi:MAG: hypothetical protein PUP91_10345 [Rhizonema sp. PD37]|nr:hypothetical protein [Rhizonema sp. PD37]
MAYYQSSRSHLIRNYVLILLVLATAIFSRLVTAVGGPSVINFLHFAFIIALSVFIIPTIRSSFAKEILLGLGILLGIILVSALLNGAGIINVVLDFLLLGEPFMLLLALTGIPMLEKSSNRLKRWLIYFASTHIVFAYFQYFVQGLTADDVKGIFLKMGAGHHVGGAIAFTVAIYILFSNVFRSPWLRFTLPLIFAYEVIMCDAKQVFAAFAAALVILLLTKVGDIGKIIQYLVITVIAFGVLCWAAETIAPALKLILEPVRVNGGLQGKSSVFTILPSYFHSQLNWLFGLGPGHTTSRLGWLIPTYINVLQPFGVTKTDIFNVIYAAQEANYFSNSITGSSLFSPLFSWAGIWGDLGVVGLTSYLYLWLIVWRYCKNDLSRFFILTAFCFGLIFSWMEEPAYMLFMVSIVGIQWQESKQKKEQQKKPIYNFTS